jgi:O-antigen/teichoic acid export membrane protein
MKYYVARIGNLVDLAMGTLLLAFVAESNAIGIYAAVSAIALKVLLGAESIEGALLPRIAADPRQGVQLAMTSFRVSLVMTVAGVAILCVTAPFLVKLLFSDAFASGAPLIWTMAPGLAIQGGAAMLMAFYRGTNRPDLCSMAVWIGMCVNAAGFFAFYPTTGLYAAGISMALGLLARSSYLIFAFARQNDARVADLLVPRRADWDLIRLSLGQILPRFDAARTRA